MLYYNISNLDTAIALGGFGAGLVVGCVSNVRKTGSLFKRHCDASKDVSFVGKHLEINRNNAGFNFASGSDFLKPCIWNPFLPLEHLAPLSLIIITQVFIAALAPGATLATTTVLATKFTFKIIVLPIILNTAVLFGGGFLRSQFSIYMDKRGIDASGHALAQSASAVYKFFALAALSNSNLACNSYRLVATVTTLSDYLWTHQTALNYHSVVEMTLSTIYMGIAFGAVYAGYNLTL